MSVNSRINGINNNKKYIIKESDLEKLQEFLSTKNYDKFKERRKIKFKNGTYMSSFFRKIIRDKEHPFYKSIKEDYDNYKIKNEILVYNARNAKLKEFLAIPGYSKFDAKDKIKFKDGTLTYIFASSVMEWDISKLDHDLITKLKEEYDDYKCLKKRGLFISRNSLEKILNDNNPNKFYHKTYKWFSKFYKIIRQSKDDLCIKIFKQLDEKLLEDLQVFLKLPLSKFDIDNCFSFNGISSSAWWYLTYAEEINKIVDDDTKKILEEQYDEYLKMQEQNKIDFQRKKKRKKFLKRGEFLIKLKEFAMISSLEKFDENNKQTFKVGEEKISEWFFKNYQEIKNSNLEISRNIISDYELYCKLKEEKLNSKLKEFYEISSYHKYTGQTELYFNDGTEVKRWFLDNLVEIKKLNTKKSKMILEEYDFIQKLLFFNSVSDFKKFIYYEKGRIPNQDYVLNKWFYDNKERIFSGIGEDFEKAKEDYYLFLNIYHFVDDEKIEKINKLG